jgi:hypothetical protein
MGAWSVTIMNVYEQLVEFHLTVFEHLAVIPQFPVLFDDKDQPCFHESPGKLAYDAFPDFLAVDIKNHQAQIVEVNKSEFPDQITRLANRTLANREKVERYARWFTSDGFQFRWRFFVRRKMADVLKSKLEAGGIQPSVTILEDVFDKLRDVMP